MQDIDWENNVENKEEKLKIVMKIIDKVKDKNVIGFGSGTTSYLAVKEIAKKVKNENIKIKAIPTSKVIEELCKKLEIPITNLNEEKPDWCFDGADEVDENNNLLKGMGGAFYREKLNIKLSKENYILVDNSKFVQKLGKKHPVPIECDINKVENIKIELKNLGANNISIRMLENEKDIFTTDNGNIILHAWFDNIEEDLEEKINKIDGVIENGLFMRYNVKIIN